MLRSPIHSPTKQPKGRFPLHLKSCKRWNLVKTKPCLNGFSNLCNVSICILGCPFQPPMVHEPSTDTALSTHDIMCNRNAYNKRSLSIFRLSFLEKIHQGTQHSGARTSNCEQRWDLQPRTSHRVLTESYLTTNSAIKQA